MGNVAVSLFRDTRYDCFNTLTEDDVAAIWEKEKYASRDSKRHRYKCGKKYILATAFKPWDIQVNAAIYLTLPTIEQQLREEKIAERQYELQRAHKLTLIHSVRSRLSVLTVPGGEFESYATRVTTEAGEINDARIGAVLGLARYDVHAAAKYLLMEMKEEDKLKAWRSALKAHIAKLPRTDAPTIGYPKENQLNAMIHYDDRTIEQALEVYDKLNAVLATVWRRTNGAKTLSYNDAYRLLRDASWKVETGVSFSLAADKAYLELRPRILRRFHPDQVEDYDPTAVRTYLRRSNFNLAEAEAMYASELDRRARAVKDFKAEMGEILTNNKHKLPSDRALLHHLTKCFWDPGFAKDYYDYQQLAAWDARYLDRVSARKKRQAARRTAFAMSPSSAAAAAAAAIAANNNSANTNASTVDTSDAHPHSSNAHKACSDVSASAAAAVIASGDCVVSVEGHVTVSNIAHSNNGRSHKSKGHGSSKKTDKSAAAASKASKSHSKSKGATVKTSKGGSHGHSNKAKCDDDNDDDDDESDCGREQDDDDCDSDCERERGDGISGGVNLGSGGSECGDTAVAAARAVWGHGQIYDGAILNTSAHTHINSHSNNNTVTTVDSSSLLGYNGNTNANAHGTNTTMLSPHSSTLSNNANSTNTTALAKSLIDNAHAHVNNNSPSSSSADSNSAHKSDDSDGHSKWELNDDDLAEVLLQEAENEATEFAAADNSQSSAERLMKDEEKRDAALKLLWQDARDRDIPLVPEDMPCEANTEINKLVSWFEGDLTTLEVDAVVNPVSEYKVLSNSVNKALTAAAGGRLSQELDATARKWRVGECKITLGYDLPAKYVIHVMVPDAFDQDAMEKCITGALDLAKKHKMHTIAIPPLTIASKNYPAYNAVHVATLTARRWLDVISNRRTIDKVIFVTQDVVDTAAYLRIMPFYFPGPSLNTDILRQRYAVYKDRFRPSLQSAAFVKQLEQMTYEDCPLKEEEGGRVSEWTRAPLTTEFDPKPRANKC